MAEAPVQHREVENHPNCKNYHISPDEELRMEREQKRQIKRKKKRKVSLRERCCSSRKYYGASEKELQPSARCAC